VLQEMFQQHLEMGINVIFLVVDWVSYFREDESRTNIVSKFSGLRLRDRMSLIFLLGNLVSF